MSSAVLPQPRPDKLSRVDLAAALSEAEARLRDYIEVSSDWVWEMDADLRFTYFSGRLLEISGNDPDQMLGRSRTDIMTDPESAVNRAHLADLAARRSFRDFIYKTKTRKGTRWFKISGKPVFAADGSFRGYRGTGTDVTAERKAKKRAEETHARFVEAIESVPASILVCDKDDRILVFNTITLNFFPYANQLLRPGTPFEDLIRAQGASGFIPAAHGRLEEWVAERMEQHRNGVGGITRKYGDGRWVRIIERRTSEGGIIGIRFDVTDLKKQEQEIATKSALLEATLDNISQGLSVFDEKLRLSAFNRGFVEFFGLTDEVARVGTSFADFIRFNAKRRGLASDAIEQQVAEKTALVLQERHHFERTRPDGRIIEIVGRRMPTGGVVTTYTDVTGQRQAAKQLAEHARELERSNAELEQFAYIASHDLQEPLRMVASYCQLLQRRYKGKLDGDADEFIGFAVEGATRMQRMINELLNYSRVGRRNAEFSEVEMRTVAEGAIEALAAAIEESGAAVELGTLPAIRGDKTLLHQLLQNLIGNGLKFRGERAPVIRVEARREGAGWLFSVADNGIGIEKEYLERIFLLFQRLHERAKYPGTGIGLAVCKKVVEHHGGRIWVESVPGEGSTFLFTIPDARPT